MLHIGSIIKDVFDKQPKSHGVDWFAAQLNCRRSNVYNIFRRPTIDTQLLLLISKILNFDFFSFYSEELSFLSDSQEPFLNFEYSGKYDDEEGLVVSTEQTPMQYNDYEIRAVTRNGRLISLLVGDEGKFKVPNLSAKPIVGDNTPDNPYMSDYWM